MQAKYKKEIISLHDLIEKILSPNALLSLFTLLSDLSASPKLFLLPESSSKSKRWNQAKPRYFNSYFNKAHEEREVVSMEKKYTIRMWYYLCSGYNALSPFGEHP